MENYVIGSIADLISNNVPKIKPTKVKSKTKSLKEVKTITESDELTPSNLENNKKNVSKLHESKENVETKKKKKKKISSDVNSESVPKKRKKLPESVSDTRIDDNAPKSKKQKIDINLNQKANSNEKEVINEEEKKGVNDKTKSKPKKVYENFTENTVFVGNIPISYDRKKICKVFSKFGEIESARIRCVPIAEINMNKKVAAIKKQYNPKRNSLVAYVKYKTGESVKAAVEANGMVIDGHHIRVDIAEENKERDNSKAVFVGGLPFDTEDDELWEFFKNCGEIKSVRIIRDSQTSMGKGFGYVNFDSTASVELALQLDGEELKKRKLNIKRCIKSRNKNKLNAFGRIKSKEITNNLLCKKGKKFKKEKEKFKKERSKSVEFQGRTANMKHKKKKKLSKTALRQRKLVKILGSS